jgi:iron complex transport system substrate-binding protein
MIRAFLLVLVLALPARAAPPRRIVSINLCADQFLIRLADPAQIAGLTKLSHMPNMSPIASQAARFPSISETAEAFIAAEPDLILTGWPGQADLAIGVVPRVQTLVVPPANSYAEIVAQVRLVAHAVGHPDRGEALVRRMDAELATIPKTGHGRVAADYQRRGYMSGAGTLIDDMIRRVGLVNLATRLGLPPLANLPLEQFVAHRPDFLITGAGAARDLGGQMLDHPAIARIARLHLPGALVDCGGPSYPQAIRLLSDQLRQNR